MTVFNFGSINVDCVYRVPHLPRPGETIAATSMSAGLGGKGANQSVAVARAGRVACHIGKVGPEGPARGWMADYGVDVTHVGTEGGVTGHASVYVDDGAENLIVVMPGANHEQSLTRLKTALSTAKPGDLFLMQNEVNLGVEAAKLAREAGLYVIYSAAPFKPETVADMLPLVDLLVVNQVEADQMAAHLGVSVDQIDVPNLLITRGADGATWRGAEVYEQPAFPVDPVDTTGAGDCFIGYVAAGLDEGLSIPDALRLGAAASAIQVTRPGTAEAIPTREEVENRL